MPQTRHSHRCSVAIIAQLPKMHSRYTQPMRQFRSEPGSGASNTRTGSQRKVASQLCMEPYVLTRLMELRLTATRIHAYKALIYHASVYLTSPSAASQFRHLPEPTNLCIPHVPSPYLLF
jgi:hypothetical protein